MNAESTAASAAASNSYVTEKYRMYVAWLLCVIYMFNQADRQIFGVLQQSIKETFHFSDGQLGLIGGTAFGLFYATLAVPIGRWADRGNRVKIITGSLLLWSLFTSITGVARNFLQMLLARLVVGVGEAGCSPAAYSIISDYFDSKRRSTAIAIYSLGISGGSIIGILIGSKVAEAYGWRAAFFIMGVPGILLAAIVLFTLREPPRGLSDAIVTTQARPLLRDVLATLATKRSFIFLTLAASSFSIAAHGIGAFYAPFLMRSHHLGLAETGRWLTIGSLGGAAGIFLCGKMTDLLANRHQDARWLLWLPAGVLFINLPIGLFLYTATNKAVVLPLLLINVTLSSAYIAPTVATTQRLVGAHERALASAVLFLSMSFVGLVLGPWLTGNLSDFFKAYFMSQGIAEAQASGDGLRFAFMCMLIAPLFAIVFYLLAARNVRQELVA